MVVVVRCGGVVECVGVGGGIRRGCFDGGCDTGVLGCVRSVPVFRLLPAPFFAGSNPSSIVPVQLVFFII